MLDIRQIPCLSDNYGYLIRDRATGAVAAIDTPDEGAINAALAREDWRLTHIFNTHWHPDHAGGNLTLKERWGCRIIGPRAEAEKIPGIDAAVGEGDAVMLGAARATVRDAPGHTLGHIFYHFPDDGAAFVGDVIFALGCGRVFEGTPAQMWASLQKIAAMAPETMLYCAHEYTQGNARFAVTADPHNTALKARVEAINAARARGLATVPMSLAEELATNPFLRAGDPAVKAAAGMPGASAVEVFAEVRRRKDGFR